MFARRQRRLILTIAIRSITAVADIAKKRNMDITNMNITITAGVAMNITDIVVAGYAMFIR